MMDDGELRTDNKRVRNFRSLAHAMSASMQLLLIWERAPKVNPPAHPPT